MEGSQHQTGRIGERKAAEYLRKKNYRILEMNYTSKAGEIDIIAQSGSDLMVFVEVKYWSYYDISEVEYSVNWRKRKRIEETSEYFIKDFPEYSGFRRRFDLIFLSKKTGVADHREGIFN